MNARIRASLKADYICLIVTFSLLLTYDVALGIEWSYPEEFFYPTTPESKSTTTASYYTGYSVYTNFLPHCASQTFSANYTDSYTVHGSVPNITSEQLSPFVDKSSKSGINSSVLTNDCSFTIKSPEGSSLKIEIPSHPYESLNIDICPSGMYSIRLFDSPSFNSSTMPLVSFSGFFIKKLDSNTFYTSSNTVTFQVKVSNCPPESLWLKFSMSVVVIGRPKRARQEEPPLDALAVVFIFACIANLILLIIIIYYGIRLIVAGREWNNLCWLGEWIRSPTNCHKFDVNRKPAASHRAQPVAEINTLIRQQPLRYVDDGTSHHLNG